MCGKDRRLYIDDLSYRKCLKCKKFQEPNTNEKVQVIVRECKDTGTKKENEKQMSETITKIKRADENASVVYLSSALGRTDHSAGTKRSAEGKTVIIYNHFIDFYN